MEQLKQGHADEHSSNYGAFQRRVSGPYLTLGNAIAHCHFILKLAWLTEP